MRSALWPAAQLGVTLIAGCHAEESAPPANASSSCIEPEIALPPPGGATRADVTLVLPP